MNIKNLVISAAAQSPEKCAFIFKDTSISFRMLKENSFKLATYLAAKGITTADRVVLCLPNIPEAVFTFFGSLSMGATVVPLDYMLTEAEIVALINHAQAKALVIAPKKDIHIEAITAQCPTLATVIVCSVEGTGYTAFDELITQSAPAIPLQKIDETSLAAIFYTSGSTGHPKGVMLTHKHFDNVVRVLHQLPLSDASVTLCAGLPFSHLGGFDYLLLMLYLRHTLILMERFHPLDVLKNIKKHRVTFLWMVPSMYVAILSLKEYDKFNLSSLKFVAVFGAPSSPALLKRFHIMCPGAHLINGWGMTESSAPNCFVLPGIENITSIGKFMPGTYAKIVDENNNVLGPNEVGELWIKGDAVMLGYYKEPDMTREVLTSDGWLKTGDIAKVDSEGLYYIVGRKRDTVKVAGEIVFLPEVEAAIQAYPGVREAAVIGVPDTLRGEVPKAFIVVQDEQKMDVNKLCQFLRGHLAHFKIPHYFECVKEIPRTGPGKIDKKKLQKMGV